MNNIDLVKIDIPNFLENITNYIDEITILNYYRKLLKLFVRLQTEYKPSLNSQSIDHKIKMLKLQFEVEPLQSFFKININDFTIGLLFFSQNQELKVILQPSLIKQAIKNNIKISNNLFRDILTKFIELERPNYFYNAALPFLSEHQLSNRILDEWVVNSDYKEYRQVSNDKNIVNNYVDNYRFFLLKN
jgi:hypothetical protein